MNEWTKIIQGEGVKSVAQLPTASYADQFGHVIWFNPATGAIVDKWDKPSMHYTHWKKTELPDVIGDAFAKWVDDTERRHIHPDSSRYRALEVAFRAGATAALK